MKYRPIFQNMANEPPKLFHRSTVKTNRTHSTLLVYSSFNRLPISACTASRGANPSYKTLYMVLRVVLAPGLAHGHVHAEALRQPVHGLRGLDPLGHHAHG